MFHLSEKFSLIALWIQPLYQILIQLKVFLQYCQTLFIDTFEIHQWKEFGTLDPDWSIHDIETILESKISASLRTSTEILRHLIAEYVSEISKICCTSFCLIKNQRQTYFMQTVSYLINLSITVCQWQSFKCFDRKHKIFEDRNGKYIFNPQKYPVLQITCVFKKLKSLFLHQTLLSYNSLESSFQDDSNEWSLDKVWWRSKEIMETNMFCTHAYLERWIPIFCSLCQPDKLIGVPYMRILFPHT